MLQHYTVHAHDIVYIVYSCMCFIVMVSHIMLPAHCKVKTVDQG